MTERIEPTTAVDEIARRVIGSAIQVHRALGPGFLECIYEEALCHELSESRVAFERQVPIHIQYKGKTIGQCRLDLTVESVVLVELKAVDAFTPIHVAQVISYLKATGFHLGLLINFNVPLLKQGIKRIIVTHQ